MRPRWLVSVLGVAVVGALGVAVAGALGACGGSPSGSPDAPRGTPPADAAPPIVAPKETWTWVPLDGMQCGDGSATGIGVNLTDRSDRVAIYFQGGGACWDAITCFQTKSAAHLEGGYGAADFATDVQTLGGSYLFQRVATNPLRDASWIYVPYCTGDLHAGTRTASYTITGGATKQAHHVGRLNAAVALARVAATRPLADVVWLVGVSAGGYGVALDGDQARQAWPLAKVHALADSAPLVTTEPTRWAAMQASWGLALPSPCAGCAADMGAIPAALRATTPAGHRYGLLADLRDQTIATYVGLTPDALKPEVLAEQAAMPAGGDQAAFVLDGTAHVLLSNPTAKTSSGVVMSDWIAAWADGAPSFANAGP